ncbi:MAG TPA: hypothetical protein VHK00_07835 [Miltoncostaeaceae bacterium]|jgi:hypothetical protein|nr:hypothetical protein [Miltoncostaeaceae bacterium]
MHIRLLRIEDLFRPPDLDPFRPEHAGYDERSGVDQMLAALRLARPKATATVTIELQDEDLPPDAQERARGAIDRYCRRKIDLIDDEIEDARRFGVRALIWGFIAVVILNGIASGIDDGWDPIAQGLSVASWVILWVPVNLLVYDLFYYRRDRRAYRALIDAPLAVVARSGGSATEGSARP